MNFTREFARHAAMTVFTTLLTGVLFYALRIILYKNLTPEEYGLFYTLFSFVMIVQTIVTFGFDPGLVPYVTQYRESKDFDAAKSLMLGAFVPQGGVMAVAICVFLFAPHWVTSALGIEATSGTALLRILAAHAACVLVFKAGQQVLLGVQAIAWRNVSDLARAVVCVAGAALLLQAGWGVLATAIAYTLGAFAEVLVQCVAVAVSLPRLVRARFSWRPALIRNAFDSGKWLSLAFGGIVVFSALDTVVISLLLSARDVAAYQIALPTATILYSLMIAAGLSLLPAVRTMWLRGSQDALTEGIERLYETGVAVMVPAGVILAVGSDVLMITLFGKNILNAGEAFDVMAIGGIAFFIAYINLHILAGIDQGRAAGLSVAGGLLVYAALLPALTYFLGIRGAALAGIAGYAFATVLSLYSIQRCLPVQIRIGRFAGVIAVSICLASCCYWLRSSGWITVDRPWLSALVGVALGGAGLAASELFGFISIRKIILTK